MRFRRRPALIHRGNEAGENLEEFQKLKTSNSTGALANLAWWIAPSLFCLALYWPALETWFRADDFAWLGLSVGVRHGGDFWTALFAPMAQGTIRPWSERAYFLLFDHLFGWDPLPYRVWAFLTQFANLALVASIAWRLTRSRLAGMLAPVLWTANTALAPVLTWTSAYNQVLCAFFILASFHFLLRWIETGRPRYNLAQWATFLLGFGAMEANAVYPVLAAAYTALCAPSYFRRVLPLFAPSIAFLGVHRLVSPPEQAVYYVMHFDPAILQTLWVYWTWAFGLARMPVFYEAPKLLVMAGVALLTAALAGFAAWSARRPEPRRQPLFLLLWFPVTLAPVLPLRDHLTEYYLFLPTIGLAILGALAVAGVRSLRGRALAGGLGALYLAAFVPVSAGVARWEHQRSQEARNLVLGVVRVRELHPGAVILLDGVSENLFGNAVLDQPFRALGIRDVYLAPGTERRIPPRPEYGDVAEFVLPPGPTLLGLEREQVVVYDASGERLKNVTALYRLTSALKLKPQTPRRVDAANPLMEHLLGPGWYPRDGSHRWTRGRASLKLAGPSGASERLYISGICPAAPGGNGPVEISVAVDGSPLPPARLSPSEQPFRLEFPLPAGAIGKESVEVTLAVSRTVRPRGDPRELGLAFGVFEVR